MIELIEPQHAADERTTLCEFLDYYRGVLLRKVDGLDDHQARNRISPSKMDLLGLVRHIALVEQWWFGTVFAGIDEPELWFDPADSDRDWHHTPSDTLAEALAEYSRVVAQARQIVSGTTSLDQLSAVAAGPPEHRSHRSMRWILVHMIEEYARHCGHADLLRERIDGSVGD